MTSGSLSPFYFQSGDNAIAMPVAPRNGRDQDGCSAPVTESLWPLRLSITLRDEIAPLHFHRFFVRYRSASAICASLARVHDPSVSRWIAMPHRAHRPIQPSCIRITVRPTRRCCPSRHITLRIGAPILSPEGKDARKCRRFPSIFNLDQRHGDRPNADSHAITKSALVSAVFGATWANWRAACTPFPSAS